MEPTPGCVIAHRKYAIALPLITLITSYENRPIREVSLHGPMCPNREHSEIWRLLIGMDLCRYVRHILPMFFFLQFLHLFVCNFLINISLTHTHSSLNINTHTHSIPIRHENWIFPSIFVLNQCRKRFECHYAKSEAALGVAFVYLHGDGQTKLFSEPFLVSLKLDFSTFFFLTPFRSFRIGLVLQLKVFFSSFMHRNFFLFQLLALFVLLTFKIRSPK